MLNAWEALPFMHTVWRAKIVWAVVFEGVIGEANLVGLGLGPLACVQGQGGEIVWAAVFEGVTGEANLVRRRGRALRQRCLE